MRILGFLLAFTALVAGGWTALWFVASSQAGHALDAWVASEQAQDRRWTCPARDIGGYPLAVAITCHGPTFAGLAFGQAAAGSLAALRVTAAVSHPRRATLDLTLPLRYRSADGQTDITLTAPRMTVDLDGLPAEVTSATISVRDLRAQGRFGTTAIQDTRADKVEALFAGVPGAADPTVDFALSLGSVAVPLLDQALGGVQPADLAVAGRLTQAVFDDAETPAALIERWRQRGGSITLSSASLARAESRVEASGSLHLDGAHRIEGALDASFTGAGPILRRYGVNPNLVAAGSILNSLFGRRDAAPRPTVPDAIRLPLQFRNGRLGVGPVTTPVSLPPLY